MPNTIVDKYFKGFFKDSRSILFTHCVIVQVNLSGFIRLLNNSSYDIGIIAVS